MAILWIESFDYLGTDVANLGLAGYVGDITASGMEILQNAPNARTGPGYLRLFSSSSRHITRVIDAPSNTLVVGSGVYCENTVGANQSTNNGIHFRIGVDNFAIRIVPNNANGIAIYLGTTLVGSSPSNVIVNGSWFWWEAKAVAGTGNATIEVRINGVMVVLITGLTFGQLIGGTLGGLTAAGKQNARYDDFVINDTDFLGDRRVVTLYPNADTVEADWTPSSGTGFSCIDESNPNDADFVTANNAGDISEFKKQSIPFDINTVAAVCPVARAFKDSAGASTFRIGINSVGNVINSIDFNPNTTVAYFRRIFEQNPNGNVPWTKSAVDNADIRLTREL